jgi:hypothetical protein
MDLHILAKTDASVLPSASVKTLGVHNYPFRSCTSTSGHAVVPTAYRILCLRLDCFVHRYDIDSATDPRLHTGSWPSLTRQGLAPCKIRRASLGAITPGIRAGGTPCLFIPLLDIFVSLLQAVLHELVILHEKLPGLNITEKVQFKMMAIHIYCDCPPVPRDRQ